MVTLLKVLFIWISFLLGIVFTLMLGYVLTYGILWSTLAWVFRMPHIVVHGTSIISGVISTVIFLITYINWLSTHYGHKDVENWIHDKIQ